MKITYIKCEMCTNEFSRKEFSGTDARIYIGGSMMIKEIDIALEDICWGCRDILASAIEAVLHPEIEEE